MMDDFDAKNGEDMISGRNETVQIATFDGQIIGSAIFAERQGTAYPWGMYVRPDCQRRDIGSALLAAVAARLPPTTTIEARVLASSPWASAFYRRGGFVEVGSCTSHLTKDDPGRPAVVMATLASGLPRGNEVT